MAVHECRPLTFLTFLTCVDVPVRNFSLHHESISVFLLSAVDVYVAVCDMCVTVCDVRVLLLIVRVDNDRNGQITAYELGKALSNGEIVVC